MTRPTSSHEHRVAAHPRGRPRSSVVLIAMALLVAVVAAASLSSGPPPAGAVGTGSIGGTVTDPGNDLVDAYAVETGAEQVVGWARVAADGSYLIDGLPDGEYVVIFGARHPYGGASTRSDEAWSGVHDLDLATPVTISGGDAHSGIDASLEPTGGVTGWVSTTAGSVGGSLISIIASDDTITEDGTWYALTNPGGGFTVTGIDVGSYRIEVDRDIDGVADASVATVAVATGLTSVGPIAVSVPTGVPSMPYFLLVTPGVGAADLRFGLPGSSGSAPLDGLQVFALPTFTGVTWDVGLDARAYGLVNGVTNRLAVAWHNAEGTGPAQVADAIPTGCAYLWFTDVPAPSPFCDEIRWLVYEGIAGGYDDATFRPSDPVSRQAMAAFLYRFAGSPNGLDPSCASATFSDVGVSHPFCGEIDWLVDAGVTTGYPDGTYRGPAPVSRQAMAAFLYRFAGSPNGPLPTCTTSLFPDVPPSHPFCGEIDWLVRENITDGYADGTFKPTNPVSRQAMAAFLQRMEDAGLTGPASTSLAIDRLGPLGGLPDLAGTTGDAADASSPSWRHDAEPPTPIVIRIPAG